MITIFLTINLFEHFKAFIIHQNKIRFLLLWELEIDLNFGRIIFYQIFSKIREKWYYLRQRILQYHATMIWNIFYATWYEFSEVLQLGEIHKYIVQFINWANFKNKKTNSNQRQMLFDMFSCSKTTRNDKVAIATLRLIYKWDFRTTFLEILELIMCGNLL